MSATLGFVEAFGPTLQGEGPQAGRAASFVRFGGCNLSCSWCDSAYTWDSKRYSMREQITLLEPREIIHRIPGAPMLVITGGEPLLQQSRAGWDEFLRFADMKFPFIAIETNGTVAPNLGTRYALDQFVVSPKLDTVDMLQGKRVSRKPWDGWGRLIQAGEAVDWKIVVSTPTDVHLAVALADEHHIPRAHLWLMPEGIDSATLAARWLWLAPLAASLGCNASHRLHVLAWGEERGH